MPSQKTDKTDYIESVTTSGGMTKKERRAEKQRAMQGIKYKRRDEFPRFKEAWQKFAIQKGTCFTYGDTYYTDYAPIPADFLVHEQHHTKQQLAMGVDAWWDRYFVDAKFRLEQELECYTVQLASIKDRNLRFRRRLEVIGDLSSAMYGNIVTKEELNTLLK